MTRRFAFDRRPPDWSTAAARASTATRTSGSPAPVGYVPDQHQPKTYQVFDTTLNKPVPFTDKEPEKKPGNSSSAKELC